MSATPPDPSKRPLIPDLCRQPAVLSMVLIAQLLAFVLSLAEGADGYWSRLGLISMHIQWVTLSTAAILCSLRKPLAQLPDISAMLFTLGLVMGITVLIDMGATHFLFIPMDTTDYLRHVLIAAIITSVALRYAWVHRAWQRQTRAEAEARAAALQARIRPHFLFNTLNTITGLIRQEPALAENMVLDISDLFRASLSRNDGPVNLSKEKEWAQSYLGIEAQRLGDRMQVIWDLHDVPHDVMLPPLTLQPLLENAVHHGIEPRTDGGTIEISGEVKGNRLHLYIRNPLPPEEAPKKPGNRIALDTVRARLEALYPDARLNAEPKEEYFYTELIVPWTS